jgi:iron complex outermembrane recepter protein
MLKIRVLRCALVALALLASLEGYAFQSDAKPIGSPEGNLAIAPESLKKQTSFEPVRRDRIGAVVVTTPVNASYLPNSTVTAAPSSERNSSGTASETYFGHVVRVGDVDRTVTSLRGNAEGQYTKEPSVSPEEEIESKLEQVIVTAQRRVEGAQQVPISIHVISSQTLAEQNYNSLRDLSLTVPGVHIENGNGQNIFIRGIGSGVGGGNPSYDQSVAIFSDDIYHGRSIVSGATFLDLDRIEILKGPQSTFFGNNAVAGALNIVSKKPGDIFDASARALYGMHGQYDGEGAVTMPIGDKVSIRVAGTLNGGSGWIKNVNTGDDAPITENKAGRVTLLFKPIDELDAMFKIEGSRNRVTGSATNEPSQWVNCPPPSPLQPTFSGSCAAALALGPSLVPSGLNNNENTGLAGQGRRVSTYEDVLTINYRKWGHTFTSVTGYAQDNSYSKADFANLPTYQQTQSGGESYYQFSQELRIASPTDQPVEYLVGAYFQTDHLNNAIYINLPSLNGVASIPAFSALAPYLPLAVEAVYRQGEDVYSVFGSLIWNVTDRLKLTAGLRGSEVKKDLTRTDGNGTSAQIYGGYTPVPPAINALWEALGLPQAGTSPNFQRTDKALMPSAGIQYQIDPQAMIYFSYAKGFKAGGFNGANPAPIAQSVEFGPEHANAYELGLKSEWFDNRVLVNLDVFRTDYTDLQATSYFFVEAINGFEQGIKNAAASRSQGVELETQWAVTKKLRLSANVTYLDSKYVSYPNGSATTLQAFCRQSAANYNANSQCSVFPFPVPLLHDYSGQPTAYAPKWSGSITASYGIRLPGEYKLTTDLIPYFSSSFNPTNDPYKLGTAGYVRLDARLTLTSPDSRWAFDLIGKNLTDRIIVDGASSLYFATKEEPRNVSVQFRYHF